MNRIPVAGPWITQLEIDYVTDAVRNDWYSGAGKYNKKFEEAFAEYVGRKFAISLPHCTAGIHLALEARGIGSGDEVLVPDITWIATAAPVSYVDASIGFVDVDANTWCMSTSALKARITPQTKAIIVVDLYGGMPDMDRIQKIASEHRLFLIEDAAESIGSEYCGKKAGGFGDVSVFSFHGSKTLTTGEGGMLVTNDESLFERVLFLRDHGRLPGDRFFQNSEIAFKYKMSGLQAALGLAQIERVEELVGKKREIFSWYKECLGGDYRFALNSEPHGVRNSYWMTSVVWRSELELSKFRVMDALSREGIDTRPFFSQLSKIPAYRHLSTREREVKNPVAANLAECGVNLPSALSLSRSDVENVAETFLRVLDKLSPK